MRLDGVRDLRRMTGVDGVEVGVEADRVVAVAPQRPHAVVMAGGIQRVADGVGQDRMGTDLDEGPVLLGGSRDGLAEQRRLAHVGHPVIGIQHRRRGALDDCRIERDGGDLGSQILERRAQLAQDRIHERGVGRDLHVDPTSETVLRAHRGNHRVDRGHRAGDHRLARRNVARHTDFGVAGDQCLGRLGVELQQRDRPLAGELGHQLRTDGDHPQPVDDAERTGDHRRGDLSHRMADHRIRVHSVGAPQLGQRQLQSHQHRLNLRIAADRLAVGDDLVQRKPDLLDENRVQLGDRLGEHRLVFQQLPTHAGPVRTLPRVHENRAGTARPVMRADYSICAIGVSAVGQRLQLGHRLGAVADADGGELRVALAVVVERVGYVGQPHVSARTLQPFRQRARL